MSEGCITCHKHIEAETTWPLFHRRHFQTYFLNENVRISIKISLKFVPKGPVNSIPTLVQIMTWRWPGAKPLSEPMMVRLPTHICVTRPQWVKVLWHISTITSKLGHCWFKDCNLICIVLTNGLLMHICVSKLTIIGSNNGLSLGRWQDIIWTNAWILLIGPLGTNFSEIQMEIRNFSFMKKRLKLSSVKWGPCCLGED